MHLTGCHYEHSARRYIVGLKVNDVLTGPLCEEEDEVEVVLMRCVHKSVFFNVDPEALHIKRGAVGLGAESIEHKDGCGFG